jgi:hypothetical protein
MRTVLFSAIVASVMPLVASADCPGNVLFGDHTAPSSVYTLFVVDRSVAALSQRVKGNGLFHGVGQIRCKEEEKTVSVQMWRMNNQVHYLCTGPYFDSQTEQLRCYDVNSGTGVIGHISAGTRFHRAMSESGVQAV